MGVVIVIVPAPGASRGRIDPLLESLMRQTEVPLKVVLVGSSEDDWSRTQAKYEFVETVSFDRAPDHVGRDTNMRRALGLNKALELGPEYVFFTDVKMSFSNESTLERAIHLLKGSDTHALCGVIHSLNDWRNRPWSWRKFIEGYADAAIIRKMPSFPESHVVNWDNAGDSESFVVTGCFMLDRKAAETLRRLGGPPRDYTISYEDYATGMRVLGANLPILVTNQIYGEHEHRSTFGGIITEHLRSGWAAAQLHSEDSGFSYARRRWRQALAGLLMIALWVVSILLLPAATIISSVSGLVALNLMNMIRHRHFFAFFYPPINIFAIFCFIFGFWDYKFRHRNGRRPTKEYVEWLYFQH
jgi:GT2 family glycosyltransferase